MEDAPASSWAETCWSCSGVTRMPVAAMALLLWFADLWCRLMSEQFYVRGQTAANGCPQPPSVVDRLDPPVAAGQAQQIGGALVGGGLEADQAAMADRARPRTRTRLGSEPSRPRPSTPTLAPAASTTSTGSGSAYTTAGAGAGTCPGQGPARGAAAGPWPVAPAGSRGREPARPVRRGRPGTSGTWALAQPRRGSPEAPGTGTAPASGAEGPTARG